MTVDVAHEEAAAEPAKVDFFISRAGEDRAAALAIDTILRDAGYRTFIQDRDFGSTAFTARMDEGFAMVDAGARIIALLSGQYQNKPHCQTEANYPLIDDPSNTRQRLIVLRIGECAPLGAIKPIPYTDLVPLLHDLVKLKQAVLHAVDPKKHPEPATGTAPARAQQVYQVDRIRPVPGFVARGETKALDDALWKKSGRAALTNSRQSNVAVKGMGGVGKSALARQYAWDSRARYQGVWWLRAELEDTLLADLVDLGCRIVDPGLKDQADRREAALTVLDHLTQHAWAKPWLLVYDNAESPEAIRTLTPTAGAHVLITTRCQDWYGEAEELPVDVFPREVAIDYLMDLARGSARQPEATRAAAGRLADDLGRLPLALAIARAQAWGNNWSFDVYRTHLAEMLTRLPTKAVDYPVSLFAAFTLSLDKAAATAPMAERLMGLAAFLSPEEIPLVLITDDDMPTIEKGEAVAALAAQSLVTCGSFSDGTPSVSVHRLVQDVMRGRLEQAGGLATTAARATTLLAQAYPSGYDGSLGSMTIRDRLVPHVIAALKHAPEAGAEAAATAYLRTELGDWRQQRGDGKGALENYRRSLAIAETLAAAHPERPDWQRDVSVSWNKIADVLKDGGDGKGALENYRRSLAIRETLAAAHPERPQFETDLVVSYVRLAGAGVDSRVHLTKAHAILQRLGARDMLTAQQQGWIGFVEAELAKLADVGSPEPVPNGAAASSAAPPATGPAPPTTTRPGFLARLLGRTS